MDFESIRAYCLSKKGATEDMPFGPDTLVFKVMGKMFALMPLDNTDLRLSLKNTPEKNIELRAQHPGIQGAYHMSKKHWNMLLMSLGIPSRITFQLIDESYNLVVKGLSKKLREELDAM